MKAETKPARVHFLNAFGFYRLLKIGLKLPVYAALTQ